MPTDIFDETKQRKNFYRNNFRRFLYTLLVCLGIIIFLIVAIFFIFLTRAQPNYYATSTSGWLKEIKPAQWGSRLPEPQQVIEHRRAQQQQNQN